MTHSWILLPLSAALALTGLSSPAFAASGLMPDPATPSAGPDPSTPSDSPVATAAAQAASTGQPVVVDSATTQTHQLIANPDGTLTFNDSLLPVRVQRNGAWVPVDATLAQNSDGTYSPAATPSGVALSGGGTGPLVTMTDPAGHSVSYTLPFTLPTPTVTGSTALYASVLPGVDLSATVTDQGGFSDTLIVHDATAAANPALKTLTLTTSTSGLTLGTDSAGDLQATAADSSVTFTAPKPVMWDSTTSTAGTQTANAKAASRVMSMATAADTATPSPSAGSSTSPTPTPSDSSTATTSPSPSPSAAPSDAGSSTASSASGPGSDAQVGPVTMGVSAGKLTLTPDQSLLAGGGTQYPVFIDPSIAPTTTSPSNHFDELYSSSQCSGSPQYDVAQALGEGAGYMQWGDGCGVGLERSLYALPLPTNIPANATVVSSKVTAPDMYAASWDCNHNQPVYLHTVGGGGHATIYSTTDWNNQPTGQDSTYGVQPTTVPSGSNPNSSCSNKDASFDTKAVMQTMINKGNTVWTVGIYGDETQSSSNDNFLRFSTGISVKTTVDVPPNAPYNVATVPNSSLPGPGCNNTGTGWISASGANGITFGANVSTDMTGENVLGSYDVWDNNENDGTGHSVHVLTQKTAYVSSGSPTSVKLTTPIDGHTYGWDVTAQDDVPNLNLSTSSPTSTECHFTYDATAPNTPQVTTPDPSFPQVGGGAANPVKYSDSTGTISLSVSAIDPLPTTTCGAGTATGSGMCLAGKASGIDHFVWKLDSQPSASDNTVPATAAGKDTAGDPQATATISPGIPNWGVHTLYIGAVDVAGNLSQVPTSYTFYVPWDPNAKIMAGDLNGDNVPDLVAVTKTGATADLDMISGNSAPGAAPTLLSTAAQSPAKDTWANYYIAHRGSSFGGSVDDLFAYNHVTGQMYVAENDKNAPGATNATPPGFTQGNNTLVTKPTCQITDPNRCGTTAGYNTTWGTGITQVTAPGDITGSGSTNFLITTEPVPNGSAHQLWLYQIQSGPSLTNPVLLGDGDWTGFTLTEGNVAATSTGSCSTSCTPTLFARDNTTGSVYSFPLTPSTTPAGSPSKVPALIHAPVHTTLQSAVVPGSGHLCADDSQSGTTNGNKIQIWTCNNSAAQTWTAAADGSLRVLGKCMDVTNGGTADGTLIQLHDCNGNASQVWHAGANGSLVNPQSSKCLADPASSTTTGTQLVLSTCDNGTEQNWTSSAITGWNTSPAAALAPILPANRYPTFASPGDVNSPTGGPDGNPDLYVTDTSGQLIEYPGAAPSNSTATFGTPQSLGAITDTAAHAWLLNDGTGITAVDSVTSSDSAVLNGGATWATNATRGNVLSLDGSTGYAKAGDSAATFDTTSSFTVSAWVNLNNLATDQTVLGEGNAYHQAFYLNYSHTLGGFSFSGTQTAATSTNWYIAGGASAPATTGTWYHLVGVYDAYADTMTLYVNGHQEGQATGVSLAPSTNSLTIGGALVTGSTSPYNQVNGMISDVRTYTTALPTADAATTNDTPTITNLN